MRIVSVESVPLVERKHVREGVFRSRTLLTGTPGTPDNFVLLLVDLPGDYKSPRHRHNFDQVRWQVEGVFDFSRDGKMRPGTIGYFPEGTRYGPSTNYGPTTEVVLQFGGASGSGYVSLEEYEQARVELSKTGDFEGGVYRRHTGPGKRTKDAYEAVWEHVNGRPLEYPAPRYPKPVFVHEEEFDWRPHGEPGITRALLGDFSEGGTRLAKYRVAAGATLPLDDHSLFFVHSGTGSVNGKDLPAQTALHVERDEQAALTARTDAELVQMGLTRLEVGMQNMEGGR